MRALISYEEAIALILGKTAGLRETEKVLLRDGPGRVLSTPVKAKFANPSFNNSAVDGYLLGAGEAKSGDSFQVVGEIKAGGKPPFPNPKAGQAVRIFTGAPVPTKGTHSIIMQEQVAREADTIWVRGETRAGVNLRKAGADFKEGVVLVPKGKRVSAGDMALAAWSGNTHLTVYNPPRIGVCVTGDELVTPGLTLREGQIYDSNGPMLETLVQSIGAAKVEALKLKDDFEATTSVIHNLSKNSQAIIIAGGASVGDHDHVPAAAEALGDVFFHGVAIKPGKPVLFAKIGKAFLFGLPGNPASAFVCFEAFVRPGLRLISGETNVEQHWYPAKFAGYRVVTKRDEFVRVSFVTKDGELWAKPVFEQGSFGMRSLSAAQGLARLQMDRTYKRGDSVLCMQVGEQY